MKAELIRSNEVYILDWRLKSRTLKALVVLYILIFNHNSTESGFFIFIETYAAQEGQACDSAVNVDLTLPKTHQITVKRLKQKLAAVPT